MEVDFLMANLVAIVCKAVLGNAILYPKLMQGLDAGLQESTPEANNQENKPWTNLRTHYWI